MLHICLQAICNFPHCPYCTHIIYCLSVLPGGWQIALAILSVCHCHFGKRKTNYFIEWSSKDEFSLESG